MLDKEKAREIAYKYSLEVAKAIKPDKVVLFGSYANGTPHNESDIDVAVFVSGLDDDAWYDTRILLQHLRWNRAFLDIEPHLMEEANDKSGFAAHVLKTGEVMYAAPGSLTPTQQVALDFLAAIESVREEDFTNEDREAFAAWDRGEFRVNFEDRLS